MAKGREAKAEIIETDNTGLAGFLQKVKQEGVEPSPEIKPEEKPESAPEVKPEEKPEVKPEGTEVKPEEKPEVKPEEKPEAKPEEKPSEFKLELGQPPKEERPDFEKRYWDTQKWATQLRQENLELQRQLGIINKKLDGTYNPEVDDKPIGPPIEYIQAEADWSGRVSASRVSAIQMYGEETVAKAIWAEDAPFRKVENLPLIQMRVRNAESPVLEAMKIVKEFQFAEKYGFDPETVYRNIAQEIEGKMKEKLSKEFAEKIKQKEQQPVGISQIKAVQSGGFPQPTEGFRSLKEIVGK